jgi:hypothetical protein
MGLLRAEAGTHQHCRHVVLKVQGRYSFCSSRGPASSVVLAPPGPKAVDGDKSGTGASEMRTVVIYFYLVKIVQTLIN